MALDDEAPWTEWEISILEKLGKTHLDRNGEVDVDRVAECFFNLMDQEKVLAKNLCDLACFPNVSHRQCIEIFSDYKIKFPKSERKPRFIKDYFYRQRKKLIHNINAILFDWDKKGFSINDFPRIQSVINEIFVIKPECRGIFDKMQFVMVAEA